VRDAVPAECAGIHGKGAVMRWRRAGVCAVVGAGVMATGCMERAANNVEPDRALVDAEVRAMLERWAAAFESRDAAGVRAVLADDEGFVWLEDGEARYRGEESIVSALASFPSGMTFSHELRDVRVTAQSDHAAWAEVATKTEIRQGESVVAGFEGVVLIVAEKEEGDWRIVAGHTSTMRPRGR